MTPLRTIFRPSTAPHYRKIVDRLLPKLHGHSRKTFSLIAGAVAEVKRAVLSEWARELPLFAKSRFKVELTCAAIGGWLLVSFWTGPGCGNTGFYPFLSPIESERYRFSGELPTLQMKIR